MKYPLMLATPGDLSRGPEALLGHMMLEGTWAFEFKMDGVRGLVEMVDGVPRITNRTGRDITYRYPDVVASLQGLPDVVLDGEIVCTVDGRPDFHAVHRRDAQATAASAARLSSVLPAQFVVFDVLVQGGVDLRALDYLHRRERLLGLAEELTEHGVVVPPVSDDGPVMWQAVCDLGLEGLVAKRHSSRYVGRRSPHWVKVKRLLRASALVSGFDPGEGSRSRTFGALRLSMLDAAGSLVPVGSVGSGFSEADVQAIWGRLQRGEHPIIVEVAFLEMSPSGQLRQPVFKGERRDIPAGDCTLAQIEGMHPIG